MNRSTKVDVVIAPGEPAPTVTHEPAPQEVEHVDVTPDPRRRVILLAPTKRAGEEEARALGIEPVAIVTPRSVNSARGVVADEITWTADLTAEDREALMPHVLPAIATIEEG